MSLSDINSLMEEDEEQRRDRRLLAEAIHFNHEFQLRSGYAQLLANVRRQNVISGHANRGIAEEGVYYRQQRLQSLSKGLKALWGNTEQQKKKMALDYFNKRKTSLVYGTWISAVQKWKDDEMEAEKMACSFGRHFLKTRALLHWKYATQSDLRSTHDRKMSDLLAYMMLVKRGFVTLRKYREKMVMAKGGERSEKVSTANEIILQRHMSSWYQYWKTRRVHSDLLLYHFALLARKALFEWRSNVKKACAREERANMSMQISIASVATTKRIIVFRRLKQAKSRRVAAMTLERVDISSYDELLVRRVFSALQMRVLASRQDYKLTSQGIKGVVMFQVKATLSKLRLLSRRPCGGNGGNDGTARRDKANTIIIFATREAMKRSLLQWLRLLTRSIMCRDAYTVVYDYMQWKKPFTKRSRAFCEWAKRVASVKIHKRRTSFALLSLYNSLARRVFATLSRRRRYIKKTEQPSSRRADFHRNSLALRRAFMWMVDQTGEPRARRRDNIVRSLMFLKFWHCAKAIYNWRLHLHKRRDHRMRWARAQNLFAVDQARLAARFWIRAAYPAIGTVGDTGDYAGVVVPAHGFSVQRKWKLASLAARRWRLFAWKSKLRRAGQLPSSEDGIRESFLTYLYKASHASSLLSAHKAAAVQCKYSRIPDPTTQLPQHGKDDPHFLDKEKESGALCATSTSNNKYWHLKERDEEGDVPLHRARPRTQIFEAYVGAVSPAYYSPPNKARNGASGTHRYAFDAEGDVEEERGGDKEKTSHFDRSPDSVSRFPVVARPEAGGDATADGESLLLGEADIMSSSTAKISGGVENESAWWPPSSSPSAVGTSRKRKKRIALAREIIQFVSELHGLGRIEGPGFTQPSDSQDNSVSKVH